MPDLPDAAPDEPNPETARRTTAIESLLPSLTFTTQQIIQLHLGEQLTFRQIAEVLIDIDAPTPVQLKRFEEACRKRYGRAIDGLRTLAQSHPDLHDLI